jgi:hypothetical protein
MIFSTENKGKIKRSQKNLIYSNSEILVIYILPQFLCLLIQQIQCTHHVQLVAEIEQKIKIPLSLNSGYI